MTSTEPAPGPRELIAASARSLFEENGYAGTSVRQIGAAAGVDPSLVIRHFGSKEALFVQVVGLEGYVVPPIEGPIETLGERLVAFSMGPETRAFRARITALVRASDREVVRESLRLATRRMFIDRLVEVLPGDDSELRAQLIVGQLGGLVQVPFADEQMPTGATLERVIALYGRAIQALVDPV